MTPASHPTRRLFSFAVLAAFPLAGPAPAGAQHTTDTTFALPRQLSDAAPTGDSVSARVPRTFFTRRDLGYTAAALGGTTIVSVFDKRIARWSQQPNIQAGASRQRVVRDLSNVTGETTFTWAALLGYGVGRLAHSTTTADVALHIFEAQVLTSVIGQAVRGVAGRARPNVSPNDQYSFHWGEGFTHYDYRSFPSLHSGAGFVAASALLTEIHERRPGATWVAAPLLYGVALVPGLTRTYLDAHWASDIASGAFVGTLLGSRVASYAHSHGRTKLDRALLGTLVVPDGHGGSLVVMSIKR